MAKEGRRETQTKDAVEGCGGQQRWDGVVMGAERGDRDIHNVRNDVRCEKQGNVCNGTGVERFGRVHMLDTDRMQYLSAGLHLHVL